jgi:hypothetical protein
LHTKEGERNREIEADRSRKVDEESRENHAGKETEAKARGIQGLRDTQT